MKDLVDALAARRTRALAMGGDDAVAKQHAAGKLTARERVDLLFDPGSFSEIGIHATHAGIAPDLAGLDTPADGMITGVGKIDGRFAAVIAYDFTVMAGSMGRTAELKGNRAREIALGEGLHYVYTGNVHDEQGGSTYCPGCKHPLVLRDWYRIDDYRITPDGRCPDCGTVIAGRFGTFQRAFGPHKRHSPAGNDPFLDGRAPARLRIERISRLWQRDQRAVLR